MTDERNSDLVDQALTSRAPIEPAFEVGPPGVGPVMGIHSGEFFQPPPPVDDIDEHTAAIESDAD